MHAMINEILNSIRDMKFREIFSKFRTSKVQEKAANNSSTKNNHAIKKNQLLKINDGFCTKEELNTALNNIDNLISNDGPKNRLLLRKADLFLRKGKFKQARQILADIKGDKQDPQSLKRAKKLLSYSHHLQQQSAIKENEKLIKKLQSIAKKYDHQIKIFPDTKDPLFDPNISQLVRKEAQHARTVHLPMLSYELINQALKAGQESPWLLVGKALSLDMMGRQNEALKILEELKKVNKGEKITKSINMAIKNAQKNNKNYRQTILNFHLAMHIKAICINQQINTKFIPGTETINAQSKVKSLIYKEAVSAISENPDLSLTFLNAILDYFPNDGAALQLKGEALAALKKCDQAIQIWSIIAHSDNKEAAQIASESISKLLSIKAKKISSSQSPQKAINFYIAKHLKLHLTPSPTKRLKSILGQIEPLNEDFLDQELREHQLQLQFNTLLIEYLETQLRERGRLNAGATALKSGAIRNTSREAS